MIVKTRFAPSPTGSLHIGSVRTALYAWLFAKNRKGRFVLRIEDTDSKRSASSFVSEIIDNLMWLGLKWDEGPYFQSSKLTYYQSIINSMLDLNLAYRCYCTSDRLFRLRKSQIKIGKKPKYDQKCRNLPKNNLVHSNSYVVRFRNPNSGVVSFHDKIRGTFLVNNEELDDLIIQRANGIPTYNFCVVIDDRDMNITHVIRGEDHINNTPRQVNILKALGASIPTYAHVSMILCDDKKKLSKRNLLNKSISEYRNEGYLPESLLNYIVRLGWSYGNQEIFDIQDMIKKFSLNNISKSPSCLNEKKLLWLNRFYIKNLTNELVKNHLKYQFKKNGIYSFKKLNLCKLIELVGSRCNTFQEIVDMFRFFYEDSIIINENLFTQYCNISSVCVLEYIYQKFLDLDIWDLKIINSVFCKSVHDLKMNFKDVAMPVRIAITGQSMSPSIHIVVYYIGKKRSLERIQSALLYIKNNFRYMD